MGAADADQAGGNNEAATKWVDKGHGEHGEDEVNGASDDDVEEYIVGSVAGAAIDLGSVVEEDVDAGPLLERSEGDTHKQDFAKCGEKKLARGGLGQRGVGALSGFNAIYFGVGVVGATNAFEDCLGFPDAA